MSEQKAVEDLGPLTSAGFHSMHLARGEQRDAGHCVPRLCALGHIEKAGLCLRPASRAEYVLFVEALTYFV